LGIPRIQFNRLFPLLLLAEPTSTGTPCKTPQPPGHLPSSLAFRQEEYVDQTVLPIGQTLADFVCGTEGKNTEGLDPSGGFSCATTGGINKNRSVNHFGVGRFLQQRRFLCCFNLADLMLDRLAPIASKIWPDEPIERVTPEFIWHCVPRIPRKKETHFVAVL